MERIQTLILDFSSDQGEQELVTAFAGDQNSNTINVLVRPELTSDELLLCTVALDGEPIETLVVEEGRLMLPFSILRNQGNYTMSFARCDLRTRLTAATQLAVRVEPDRLTFAPVEQEGQTESFASYILARLGETDSHLAEQDEHIDGKLDKALSGYKLYGTDYKGAQTTFGWNDSGVTPSTFPRRTGGTVGEGGGCVRTAMPIHELDAANKTYVDVRTPTTGAIDLLPQSTLYNAFGKYTELDGIVTVSIGFYSASAITDLNIDTNLLATGLAPQYPFPMIGCSMNSGSSGISGGTPTYAGAWIGTDGTIRVPVVAGTSTCFLTLTYPKAV